MTLTRKDLSLDFGMLMLATLDTRQIQLAQASVSLVTHLRNFQADCNTTLDLRHATWQELDSASKL